MKKAFLIVPLLIALTATPAIANQGQEKRNEKANEKAANVVVTTAPTSAPNITPVVSPSVTYRNHGAYVSEVAKTHPGGEVVSAAAQSNVGKKTKPSTTPAPTASITVTPTVSPTVDPSVTPTITVTPTLEPTLTATPSPTGTITQTENDTFFGADVLGVNNLIKTIKDFIHSLIK